MNGSGDRKYSDAPKGHQLNIKDIRDHLAGRRTWAVTLASSNGHALAGCRDYDQGGEAIIDAALAAAHATGIVAFGIHIPGASTKEDHDGGHIWTLYDRSVPIKDIVAQLATLPGENGEIYPNGNPIRLPLGLHRRKQTRGTLILQDGRRFNLDQTSQFVSALRALLALRRNVAPPPAPEHMRPSSGGSAFGTNYVPENWKDLPDGAALMASPRYQLLFRFNSQLSKLVRGERVTLYRNGVADDSDSAQIAVLVANLITSHRKGRSLGDGAPPESEIRAVALYWKNTLRKNKKDEHYKSHIDTELARYRPATYLPEVTTQLGNGQPLNNLRPLTAPEKRSPGRPTGVSIARQDRLNLLVDLLIVGERVRRKELSEALNVSMRRITSDLAELKESNRIDYHPVARGILITRVERKLSGCEDGNNAKNTAPQCDSICTGETPAPPICSDVSVTAPISAVDTAPSESADSVESLRELDGSVSDATAVERGGAGVSPLSVELTPQSSPQKQLIDLVREVFDFIPELYQRLNKRTGEVTRANVTRNRVRAEVRSRSGGDNWSDVAIDRATIVERKRRAWDRRRAWEADRIREAREAASAASTTELRRQARSTAATYVQKLKKCHPLVEFSRIIAGIWAAEEARREQRDESEQGVLHDLADQALAELRSIETIPPLDPTPVVAVDDVHQLPPMLQLDLFNQAPLEIVYNREFVRVMIDRLKARTA